MLSVVIHHRDKTISHIEADEASEDLMAFRCGKQIVRLDPGDEAEIEKV